MNHIRSFLLLFELSCILLNLEVSEVTVHEIVSFQCSRIILHFRNIMVSMSNVVKKIYALDSNFKIQCECVGVKLG